MNIEPLKSQLPDYAKDIKLNLSSVLTEEGAPDLSQKQIYGIALAAAFATKSSILIDAIENEVSSYLDEKEVAAAKAASTIMAMNNVYYRFVHLVNHPEIAKLPAKLRMNVIANPQVDKVDFELNCLAVSALNGCGMCMEAHTRELMKANLSPLAIQSAVRIAAVLNAAALSLQQ